jgi:elongation factor P hydroxylase
MSHHKILWLVPAFMGVHQGGYWLLIMITRKEPPDWRYNFKCEGCEAELTAEFYDVKCNSDSRKYVVCIWCDTTHWLENVPRHVELRTKARQRRIEANEGCNCSSCIEEEELPS